MWGDPIRILKESNAVRTDGRLPTGLASLAASLAGVGGGLFVFLIFNFFNDSCNVLGEVFGCVLIDVCSYLQ